MYLFLYFNLISQRRGTTVHWHVFALSKYLCHLHDKCFPALVIFLLKLHSLFFQLQFFLGPSFLISMNNCCCSLCTSTNVNNASKILFPSQGFLVQTSPILVVGFQKFCCRCKSCNILAFLASKFQIFCWGRRLRRNMFYPAFACSVLILHHAWFAAKNTVHWFKHLPFLSLVSRNFVAVANLAIIIFAWGC